MAILKKLISIEEVGEVSVVNFCRQSMMDDDEGKLLVSQLFSLIEEEGENKILLDFSNVEYMSSFFLGTLIVMQKKIKKAKGRLAMCNMTDGIYEKFEITKLHRILNIQKNQLEGLKAFD